MLFDNMLHINLNNFYLFSLEYNIFNYLSFCRVIDFVNEDVQTMAGNGTKGSGGRKGTNQV